MKLLTIGFVYIIYSITLRKQYNVYWGLLFIFLIMALQSNVDGDYMSYWQSYDKVAMEGAETSDIRAEFGWFYLTKFFSYIVNFKGFIIILSLCEYHILARFVKRFAKQPFMFAAGLIFFFNMNMMLLQMKAIRQGLTIELMVASFILIDKKKPLWGSVIAAIAPMLHTSAFLFIPMLILFYLFKKVSWWQKEIKIKDMTLPIIITIGYIFVIVNKMFYIDYWKPILLEQVFFGKEGYFGDMSYQDQSILIYLYGGAVVFTLSYYLKYALRTERFIVIMAIIGQFAGDFLLGQGSLFRLPLYFSIFSIIALPNTASFLYKREHKTLSLLFIILCVGYAWRTFMPWVYRPQPDGFYTYKFLFE